MKPELTLFSVIMLLGAAHGLFLALALLNAKGRSLASHYFLALLTLAFVLDLGHEFLNQSRYLLKIPPLYFLDPTINLVYGPCIYLYVCELTNQHPIVQKRESWVHFLPFSVAILVVWFLPDLTSDQFVKLFYRDESPEMGNESFILRSIGLIALFSTVSIGIYLALSFRRLSRHADAIRQQFSSIERITLNWLRNLLIALSFLYVVLLFDGLFSDVMGLDESVNRLLYLLIVSVIYSMSYLGLRQPAIFVTPETKKIPVNGDVAEHSELVETHRDKPFRGVVENDLKYKSSALDSSMSEALKGELKQHMITARPYLDNKLTLPQLAEQLSIPSNYLSQVINEQFEKNFFDFVNDYRVDEARRRLADPDEANATIISIAYASGFNSKSVFYTAFKKNTGITPSKYRTQNRKKNSPEHR